MWRLNDEGIFLLLWGNWMTLLCFLKLPFSIIFLIALSTWNGFFILKLLDLYLHVIWNRFLFDGI
jgi:hypothetical protein